MTRTIRRLLALTLALSPLVACTTTGEGGRTAPPPPAVQQTHLLVDPRIGYPETATPRTDRAMSAAWARLARGDLSEAGIRAERILERTPGYRPAMLALAAIALERDDAATAERWIERAAAGLEGYTAARIYRAELALAGNDPRRALELYRETAAPAPIASRVQQRLEEVRMRWYEELLTRAGEATPEERIALLAEALEVVPAASATRIELVNILIAAGRLDQARTFLDPLLATDPGQPDVQAALAEIDVGEGRYQEAIARLEMLAARSPEPRFEKRLREVKRQWVEANLPPRYHEALSSEVVTRSDLAVLMFWKVSGVRFARNLAQPPIALDLSETAGREEIVRAMALGIYRLDPVTRRVFPETPVTAANFVRHAANVLTLRGGAPPCAKTVAVDGSDLERAAATLRACGIEVAPLLEPPDATIDGRTAARILEAVDESRIEPVS